jgi:hypothetical protein
VIRLAIDENFDHHILRAMISREPVLAASRVLPRERADRLLEPRQRGAVMPRKREPAPGHRLQAGLQDVAVVAGEPRSELATDLLQQRGAEGDGDRRDRPPVATGSGGDELVELVEQRLVRRRADAPERGLGCGRHHRHRRRERTGPGSPRKERSR